MARKKVLDQIKNVLRRNPRIVAPIKKMGRVVLRRMFSQMGVAVMESEETVATIEGLEVGTVTAESAGAVGLGARMLQAAGLVLEGVEIGAVIDVLGCLVLLIGLGCLLGSVFGQQNQTRLPTPARN
jgi:hypothetical protein